MMTSVTGDLQSIKLPLPVFDKSGDLFGALKLRRTSRLIGDEKISLESLADILWAAQGVNRLKGPFGIPGLTAGSASNSQEVRIYVAREEGTYLYESVEHALVPVIAGDHRGMALGPGQGATGAKAPARFIYVADIEKFKNAGFQEPGLYDPEIQKAYYFVDTGLIAQNVYLAAASLGLAAWFHNCNRDEAAKKLGLKLTQKALFGQTIGYEEE